MGAEWSDKYAACPYYLSNYNEEQRKKGQIRCEGVSKGNTISLVFGSETNRRDYKKKYCHDVSNCHKCPIHLMLDRKYGDDGVI